MLINTIKYHPDDDGFSSEQSLQQQRLNPQPSYHNQPRHKNDSTLQYRQPIQIQDKVYSLHPDIATGWIPKFQLCNPIPLSFPNPKLNTLLAKILSTQQNNLKLCYLGPRYETTFQAWYFNQIDFPYKHLNYPKNLKSTDRVFHGQNPLAKNKDDLQFDGSFQSGNLDMVLKTSPYTYQLYMRVDSNTRGHLQWYNFKVTNLQKSKQYTFLIKNFQKGSILYKRNMKPYILSKKKSQIENKGWQQTGSNIKFYPFQNQQVKKQYVLQFDYCSNYGDDQIHIAYCIPYTYTQLKQFIKTIPNINIVHVTKLGLSLGGIQIPLLTITNNLDEYLTNQKQNKRVNKKMIIAIGRIHPGQSNGSYMMEGFIKSIIDNSAQFARNHIVFKIIPMLNPDGVIIGNYRTGISGKDLNRQFLNNDKIIFPQVYRLKQLVKHFKQLYDFHGHSIKKNIFMYGPQFSLISKNYYECRILPKIISMKTQMFRYYSCSFKVTQLKQATARGVLFRIFNIPFTYTIEASNGFYQSQKDIPFDANLWTNSGYKVGQALFSYIKLTIQIQTKNIQRLNQRKIQTQKKYHSKNKTIIQQIRSKQNKTVNKFKTSINFNKQQNVIIENQQLKQIINQIENQQKLLHDNYNSEDQISQGSSDVQSQSNNISQSQRKIFIDNIKTKIQFKNIYKKSNYKNKIKTQANIKIPSNLQTIITQEQKEKPIENIQYNNKKNYKRKKSYGSVQYKKKQEKPPSAKVNNIIFHLSINPYKNNIIDQSFLQTQIPNIHNIYKRQKLLDRRKINCRSNEFPQNFHKTFLSYYRQMKRKQNKQVLNLDLIEQNLRIKRIHTSFQQP